MQCNDCLNNKNGICFADESMSCAGYEHCLSFKDKSLYMQGAREFAEWLVYKGILGNRCIYNGEITDYGKVYLAEWQKGTEE